MTDHEQERREAHIAEHGTRELPMGRKTWVPTMGEPNDVDAEALVAAVQQVGCIPASRYRPETKRDFLFIRNAVASIMAQAPPPPRRLGSAIGLDLEERLAALEAAHERTQTYTEALYRWCKDHLAACLVEHIAHLEQQRLIDMLNTPWETEIKFYSREVLAEREHEYRKLIADCVALLGCLRDHAVELGHQMNAVIPEGYGRG